MLSYHQERDVHRLLMRLHVSQAQQSVEGWMSRTCDPSSLLDASAGDIRVRGGVRFNPDAGLRRESAKPTAAPAGSATRRNIAGGRCASQFPGSGRRCRGRLRLLPPHRGRGCTGRRPGSRPASTPGGTFVIASIGAVAQDGPPVPG